MTDTILNSKAMAREIRVVADTKEREILRIPDVRTRIRLMRELVSLLRGFPGPDLYSA